MKEAMDTKITLSFNKDIIDRAKDFANQNNISLSRLTEFLYAQMTSKNYQSLEELPIADWVNMVSEGEVEYKRTASSRKAMKDEFFGSKKMKVFLDANVLVSVLNKEYPLFPHSARILSLADQLRYQLYTTPICLAIAFYFAEKKKVAQASLNEKWKSFLPSFILLQSIR